jgi:hypothetical protein
VILQPESEGATVCRLLTLITSSKAGTASGSTAAESPAKGTGPIGGQCDVDSVQPAGLSDRVLNRVYGGSVRQLEPRSSGTSAPGSSTSQIRQAMLSGSVSSWPAI